METKKNQLTIASFGLQHPLFIVPSFVDGVETVVVVVTGVAEVAAIRILTVWQAVYVETKKVK